MVLSAAEDRAEVAVSASVVAGDAAPRGSDKSKGRREQGRPLCPLLALLLAPLKFPRRRAGDAAGAPSGAAAKMRLRGAYPALGPSPTPPPRWTAAAVSTLSLLLFPPSPLWCPSYGFLSLCTREYGKRKRLTTSFIGKFQWRHPAWWKRGKCNYDSMPEWLAARPSCHGYGQLLIY